MSKYTAEQARSSLQKMHGHPLTVAERAELFSMASNYADLLRERESAKTGVTDEIFEAFDAAQTKAMGEYEMQQYHAGKESHLVNALDFATRAALKAVAPMLASARVPDGWLPIESAPNDGAMHVRGLMVHGNDGKALYWDACAGHLDAEDGQFLDQGGNDFGWNADDFTHWHPLAAAPKPEKE